MYSVFLTLSVMAISAMPISAMTVSAMVLGLTAPDAPAHTSIRSAHSFPANSPMGHQSVLPLSTDGVPALGRLAGSPSASSSGATFVPQIAQNGDEADPILSAPASQLMTPASQLMTPASQLMPQAKLSMAQSAVPASYWGDILGRYCQQSQDGLTRFDYARLQATPKDMNRLNAYIEHMAAQKLATFSRNDAMAYWANLYNALTVRIVAQNYPVTSIRKIKSGYRRGPWRRDLVVVEGRKLSLDDIENDILRPTSQTPLVHYMINCASVGCPNLKTTPWQGANLVAEQEAAARAYINSARGVNLNNGRLQVSKIYKWFKADFNNDKAGDNDKAGVLAHLRQYADAELRTALLGRRKIDKYVYDWRINAPK